MQEYTRFNLFWLKNFSYNPLYFWVGVFLYVDTRDCTGFFRYNVVGFLIPVTNLVRRRVLGETTIFVQTSNTRGKRDSVF
jgi:hypothetical protein